MPQPSDQATQTNHCRSLRDCGHWRCDDDVDAAERQKASRVAQLSTGNETESMTWQVRRVLHYLRDHLADEIDVSTLIALTGFRRARFFASFKASVGHAPLTHLRCLRLLRAKCLLRDTRMSITAISAEVGLEPTRLSAAFKRSFGTTPSRYRASNGTGPDRRNASVGPHRVAAERTRR